MQWPCIRTMVEYESTMLRAIDSIVIREVDSSRDIDDAIAHAPVDARAFRFFQVAETWLINLRGIQLLRWSKRQEFSKWYYIDAEVLDADEVRRKFRRDQQLVKALLAEIQATGCDILHTWDDLKLAFHPEREAAVSFGSH